MLSSIIIIVAVVLAIRRNRRWEEFNRSLTPTPYAYSRRTSSYSSSTHISNSHFNNLSEHKSNRISTHRQSSHSNLIENKSLTPIEKAREDIPRLSESIQKITEENNKLEHRINPLPITPKPVCQPTRSPIAITAVHETETVTEIKISFEKKVTSRRRIRSS